MRCSSSPRRARSPACERLTSRSRSARRSSPTRDRPSGAWRSTAPVSRSARASWRDSLRSWTRSWPGGQTWAGPRRSRRSTCANSASSRCW